MSKYLCKAKLKVGDKVRIRPLEYFDKNFKKRCHSITQDVWYETMYGMAPKMLEHCGKVCAIKAFYNHDPYAIRLVEDEYGWVYGPDTYTKVTKKEEL